jgi:hypothetical protein
MLFEEDKDTSEKSYTQTFEEMVTRGCGGLTCRIVNKGGKKYVHEYTYTTREYLGEETGPSDVIGGPPTRIRYYGPEETRTRTEILTTAHSFECSRCGSKQGGVIPPKVTIQQKGNTKVLKINEFMAAESVCSKPHLEGKLAVIWNRSTHNKRWRDTLESMWKAARQLDLESGSELNDGIIYKVETSSLPCNLS